MPKTKLIRQIDKAPRSKVGDAPESGAVAPDFAPPSLPRPLAPTNLALTTATEFATASPSARVTATWDPPPGVQPRSYVAQISESNTFPAAGTLTLFTRADQESVDFSGRRPGVTQYVRVAAVTQTQGAWSATVSIVADTDITPAGQVTSLAGTWVGYGDLLLTWTNPSIVTYPNFRDAEIKIFASSGGAQLGPTFYSSTGRFLFTAAMNLQYTSGAGDPSLFVEVRSRTWSNVVNNSSVPTLTTTKARPSVPTVAHSWSSDTDHNGVAGADLTFTLTLSADTAKCLLALNAQAARDIYGTVYTYPYSRNVADNGSLGDATIAYSITAVDGLGQTSVTAATGTATNEDPPTPTAVLAGGAVSLLVATIGGTVASDFWVYEVVWKRDGTTVATRENAQAVQHYELSGVADGGVHDWTVVVRQRDRFGLYGNGVTSSPLTFDGMTLELLRKGTHFRDNLGTAANLLDALKDDNRASGGITYPA